jgi:hypothetical protein
LADAEVFSEGDADRVDDLVATLTATKIDESVMSQEAGRV